MKKKSIIGALLLVAIGLILGSLFFYQKNQAQIEPNKQTKTSSSSPQKSEKETFKAYNEQLIHDIYFFNPEEDNETKRSSLGERMTQELVDQMCPPLPASREKNQSWNEVLDVKTVEIKETSPTTREVVTDYRIKTDQDKTFDLSSRAFYEQKENKWIMTAINPEQREE